MEPVAGYLLRLLIEMAVLVLAFEVVAVGVGAVRRAMRRHSASGVAGGRHPAPHAA